MAGEPTVGIKALFDGTAAIKGIKNVTDSINATTKAAKKQSSATGGIMRLQKSVSSLISTYAAAAAGVVAVGAAVWSSVKEYAAAEAIQIRLERAINTAEGTYSRYDKQVQGVIASQSRLAAVEDEEVAASLTKLVQMTGDLTEAERLNQIALDMSRATGKDLAGTAMVIGKVYNGNVGALKRYGVVVKDGATVTEALGELQKRYTGYAADYGQSMEGAATRMATAWGNVKEAVGGAVANVGIPTVMNMWSARLDALASGDLPEFVHQVTLTQRGFNKELDSEAKAQAAATAATASAKAMMNGTTLAVKRYASAVKEAKTAVAASEDAELNSLNAKQRVKDAQNNLTAAVKKYGPKSREARIATLELKQAHREAATAAGAYKKAADDARKANQRVAREKAAIATINALRDAWRRAYGSAGDYRRTIAGLSSGTPFIPAGKGKGFSRGGRASGPTSGYPATLHGTEWVVPERRDANSFRQLGRAAAALGAGIGNSVTVQVSAIGVSPDEIRMAARQGIRAGMPRGRYI